MPGRYAWGGKLFSGSQRGRNIEPIAIKEYITPTRLLSKPSKDTFEGFKDEPLVLGHFEINAVDGTQPQTLHIPADDLQTADRSFNTPVGNKPHQGYQNVDRVRDPCIKEREQDAGNTEHRRNLALEV